MTSLWLRDEQAIAAFGGYSACIGDFWDTWPVIKASVGYSVERAEMFGSCDIEWTGATPRLKGLEWFTCRPQ